MNLGRPVAGGVNRDFDDLPEAVKTEVQAFADVNIAWLSKVLLAARVVSSEQSEGCARAILRPCRARGSSLAVALTSRCLTRCRLNRPGF